MPVLKIKQNGVWKEIAGGGSVAGGSVELDTTLTQEGMAADAKAVGDALDALDIMVAIDENDDGNIELGTFSENNDIIGLPTSTIEDNGKFLRVVNGIATWQIVQNAEEASF